MRLLLDLLMPHMIQHFIFQIGNNFQIMGIRLLSFQVIAFLIDGFDVFYLEGLLHFLATIIGPIFL